MSSTQRITDAVRDAEWRANTIDRLIRSAVQGYAAVWLATGAAFDGLLSWEPAKGAAVAIVLSVLFTFGATQVGDPTQNNYKTN
jgi:hypothetical protein